MKITLLLPEPIAPIDISMIENAVKTEFGLSTVAVTPVYRETTGAARRQAKKRESNTKENAVIYGREIRDSVTPMDKVTLDLGKATVCGEVFDVQSKEIAKRNAWVMSFDMTDYTSSIHVSKFMTDERAGEIVAQIKKGMFLTVSGKPGLKQIRRGAHAGAGQHRPRRKGAAP